MDNSKNVAYLRALMGQSLDFQQVLLRAGRHHVYGRQDRSDFENSLWC